MNKFLLYIALLLSGIISAQSNDNTLCFVENKGQVRNQNNELNQNVLFLFGDNSSSVQLRKTGFSYDIFQLNNRNKSGIVVNRIDVNFKNVNPQMVIQSYDKLELKTNYMKPSYEKAVNIGHFNLVIYKDVYPNIDFEFKKDTESGLFKYDIVLHPGANMNDIQLEYSGFNEIGLINNQLILSTTIKQLKETIPYSFIGELKREIKVDFSLTEITGNSAIVGFISETQNPLNEKLTIDPYPSLSWGKYIGDSLYTEVKGVITDRFGYVYICGSTQSLSNIATSGAHQDTIADSLINDAFLSKYHKYGGLLWSTYFGGEAEDIAHDVYVDTSFNVFLAGTTFSSTGIIDSIGFQDTLSGAGDAFIAKFDQNGILKWSTYFGGDSLDQAFKLSTDFLTNVYVTGETGSSTGIAFGNSNQQNLSGIKDGFIAKFDSLGLMQWSTYVGGSGIDEAYGIAFGDTSVYVVGETTSNDLQTTSSSHQENLNGVTDGFISKFNRDGMFVWQTYFGGEKKDDLKSVKVLNGNVYFIGSTLSDSNIVDLMQFPQIAQATKSDSTDAYVGKMNGDGILIWSTYIGGDSVDIGIDLFFELDSSLLIVGTSYSDSIFGIYQGSYQQQNNGSGDFFISKIMPTGDFIWSTFYGGTNTENAEAISVFGNTSIYVVGSTKSDSALLTVQDTLYPNIFNSELEGIFSKFLQGFSTIPSGVGGSGGCSSCTPCPSCPGGYSSPSNWQPHYYCPGEQVMLTVTGGDLGTDADWIWYANQCGNAQVIGTGDTIYVYPTLTTTYFVRAESITNATDCISTTIWVAPYPDYSILTDSVICNNIELELLLSGSSVASATGNWTGPDNFLSDSLYVNLGLMNDSLTGMYVLHFIDTFSCIYTDSIDISISESPIFSVDQTNVSCFGGNDGSISILGDSSLNATILWSNGVQNSDSIIDLIAGWYSYEVINQSNCSVSDSIEITTPASFLLDTTLIASECLAENGMIILVLDSINGSFQITCDSITQTSDTIANLDSGDLIIILSGPNGCSEEHHFTIENVNSLTIVVDSVVNITCAHGSNGEISVHGLNGNPPYIYEWTPINSQDSILTDLEVGWYAVELTDQLGCVAVDSIEVESNNNFSATYLVNNSSCVQPTGSIQLVASGTSTISNVYWSTGDTSITQLVSIWPGSYSAVVVDSAGCTDSIFVLVNAVNDLNVYFSPAIITLNVADSIQLSPIINYNSDSCSFNWNPVNDLSCSDCLNPFTSTDNDIEYLIVVSNSFGCIDSATVQVNTIDPCIEVFIPTIFSPNNDGLNDTWSVIGTCIQTIHIKVYNQWGEMIFHTNDQSQAWDGTFNGNVVPIGQYTYQVMVTYIGSGNEVFEGFVQVTN